MTTLITGGAGFVGHIEVCDRAVIGGMTMVTRSITQPGFYTGAFPLMTNRDWERAAVNVRQLDALRRRVRALERAVPGASAAAADASSSATGTQASATDAPARSPDTNACP